MKQEKFFIQDISQFSDCRQRELVTDEFYLPSNVDFVGNHRMNLDGSVATNSKIKFVNNPDVVAIGCSNTTGEGLPDIYSWPSLVRNCFGLTVNNYGKPGSGVTWQVASAMKWMQKHGSPKTVLALFPEFDRGLMPEYRGGEVLAKEIFWDMEIGSFIKVINGKKKIVAELTDFQNIKYHIPAELIIFYSFMMLDALVSHLEQMNSEFRFSSWTSHTADSLEKLNYSGFIPKIRNKIVNKNSLSDRTVNVWWQHYGVRGTTECIHFPQTDAQKMFWDIAADHLHPGLHDQIHFAEHLMQKEITNEHLKTIDYCINDLR
jgi:hypothetical protein